MDRTFWFRFCVHAKWCLLMALFAVFAITTGARDMDTVAGEVVFGLGMIVIPIMVAMVGFAQLIQGEFAPAASTRLSQNP